MAGTTPRFGLNFFGGDTPGTISDDAEKYTSEDRLTIDAVLTALESHTHRVTSHLPEPDALPTAVAAAGGGALEGGTEYFYVISFVDDQGLETITGPETSATTGDVLPTPDIPQGETSTDSGTLDAGLYYYALSGLRDDEESAIGDPAAITVLDDEDTVTLTLPALGDATSYQVWRMADDDPGYTRIGTSTTGSFVDHGTVPAGLYGDPANQPPLIAEGADNYAVTISLTGADLALVTAGTVTSWKIYRSTVSGNYGAASLVHQVIERLSDTDPTSALLTTWVDDGDALLTGSPQLISSQLSIPPLTFEAAAPLPAATGYPVNYPIVDDATGILYLQRAGAWSAMGGSTGPTGPTGATGASGPAGPSGTPGGGGGGGGATTTRITSTDQIFSTARDLFTAITIGVGEIWDFEALFRYGVNNITPPAPGLLFGVNPLQSGSTTTNAAISLLSGEAHLWYSQIDARKSTAFTYGIIATGADDGGPDVVPTATGTPYQVHLRFVARNDDTVPADISINAAFTTAESVTASIPAGALFTATKRVAS